MGEILKNRNLRQLALISLFFGFTEAMFSLRATFLAANGLNATQVGVVFSVSGVVGTIAPLLGGVLADRFFTRYKVFIASLFGFALTIGFLPLSAQVRIGGLILAMFLMPMLSFFHPMVSNMIQTCSINATNGLEKVDYSYLRAFMSTGYIISNILCTPIISRFGLNAPFYFVLVFFIGIFALRLSLKENETDRTRRIVINKRHLHFSDLLRNYYVVSFVAITIFYAGAGCCASYMSYMVEYIGEDVSKVTLVAGLKVIGEVLVMVGFPLLRRHFSLSGLQILSGSLLILELILMTQVRTLEQMIFFEIIGGMGAGISLSSASHYLRAMTPSGLEATAASLWSAGTSLGGILLPFIFGIVIDRFGVVACYRVGAVIQSVWVLLFIGTLLFGKYVLKKDNVCPIFLADRNQTETQR